LIPYETEASLDSRTEALRFLDRETGAVREETIYGRAALEFAYRTGLGRAALRILPHGMLSRMYGALNRLPASRNKIPGFIESLAIDASEAELPVSEYRSLDEFFCRRLKPDARPVDRSPSRFVSPADGRTMVFPAVADREFQIKGCRVRLTELLESPAMAEFYQDGTAIVVRLAPSDYHRFHFPASGIATDARLVNGRLHSVHPFALESRAPSFRNKRTITHLDSESFGHVTLIEVGAFAVGTIVQTYVAGPVERGQEKGYFRFGGSTVVVLIPANRIVVDEDLIAASERGLETFVRMGTSIGSAASR
jgi:phosphatidylserine decarboxylase